MRTLIESAPPPPIVAVLDALETDRLSSTLSATAHWNDHSAELQPVRDWLAARFHNKCVFCESIFGHVGFNNIEHLAPKARFPCWTYEWRNLLLGCQICNTKKAQSVGIAIHPVYEPPEGHVEFTVDFIHELTQRGLDCITKLELNRDLLVTQRGRHLSDVKAVVSLVGVMPEAADLIATYLEAARGETAPWSASVTALFGDLHLTGSVANPVPSYDVVRAELQELLLDALQ